MASLLDRSLDDIKEQRERGDSGRRVSRGAGNSRGARPSPYSRPSNGRETGEAWKHDLYDSNAPSRGGRGAAAGGGASNGTSAKLVVTNLHWEVSERELETLFAQIGELLLPPKIKFDRSGRSEGQAWITYKSAEHAARAKKEFNGAQAKGKPITVEFDMTYRGPRPVTAAPSGGTAAAGSLLARLDGSDSAAPSVGSIRGRGGARGGSRGSAPRGAPAGPRGGAGKPRVERERKKPVTASDLDNELEAFMSPGESKKAEGDTEMAS